MPYFWLGLNVLLVALPVSTQHPVLDHIISGLIVLGTFSLGWRAANDHHGRDKDGLW